MVSFVYTKTESGCWNHNNELTATGYTRKYYQGKVQFAHRVSYLVYKGEIPTGMFVRHICDNKICINPDHLVVGTHEDNMRDAIIRGRMTKGIQQRNAKLTEDKVKELRKVYTEQKPRYVDLGNMFGVSKAVARRVALGLDWKHVSG